MTAAATMEPTELEELIEAQAEAAHEREVGDATRPTAEDLAASPTRIDVEGLDLFYGDHHALKDVNIKILDKQITSFIGPSGCGKSTLLRCFNRMNDGIKDCRIEGKIALDGQNILGDYDICRLRQRVGMVFQRPNPFPMSIYDNVAYGPRGMGVRDRVVLDELVEDSCDAPRCGTRSRISSRNRAWSIGRPAAASVHRPCAGRAARHSADGRADLGARPRIDAGGGAAGLRAQGDLHAGGRYAQHAAGCAHLRLGRVLFAGRAGGACARCPALQNSDRSAYGGLFDGPFWLIPSSAGAFRVKMRSCRPQKGFNMIYYVEDDDNIRDLTVHALRKQGIEAEGFSCDGEFKAAVARRVPDAVLLDIMLPDTDGLAIMRRLRADRLTATVPIMMLTAKDTELDKVMALDGGADDYLTKPFSLMELASRCRALLRRGGMVKQASDVLSVGDIVLAQPSRGDRCRRAA